MSKLLFILSLLCFTFSASAQKIGYSMPDNFRKDISKKDYRKLVDIAVPVIAKRYTVLEVSNGTVLIAKNEDHMSAFNLDNLVFKCLAVDDRSKWHLVIEEHFNNIFTSIDVQKKIKPKELASIRDYLSFRIYPQEMVEQQGGGEHLVVRIDLEGTITVLMMDLPGAFSPVMKEYFEAWNIGADSAFRIAQANINNHHIEQLTQLFTFEGVPVEVTILAEENYAASILPDLKSGFPQLVGEWGSVIAVPHKAFVELCKVNRDRPFDFVKFIQGTKSVVDQEYMKHPQRISNRFYWYYNGVFHPITVTENNGSVNIVAPMELSELMMSDK